MSTGAINGETLHVLGLFRLALWPPAWLPGLDILVEGMGLGLSESLFCSRKKCALMVMLMRRVE